jgi:Dyp-type peroxidase family
MGVHVTAEDGDILPGDLAGHEHFGFDDGVSQPGIRGRASAAPDDYVTPRYVDPDSDPVAAATSGYPGQSLVWPGEFVLGYPATGPDPLRPGPVAEAVPKWTKNGSFLVFRRLHQDVALLWQWIHAQVQAEVKAGATSLDDISLAARLIGRWPSGAPFNRTPEADNPVMGGDPFENNNFIYNSDTPNVKFGRGDGSAPKGTKFPNQMAGADPAGITCPWAAHIRKVNTRDSPSDVGSTTATYARRVLRVGVPYGPPIEDRYTNDGVDRGLLFLSVQSSIEEQFEFLQSRWMNDPTRPKTPGGNDMLVGQNTPAEGHVRSCNIFLPGVTASPSILSAPRQFVIPTGGGYFFLPSLSALRGVISGI